MTQLVTLEGVEHDHRLDPLVHKLRPAVAASVGRPGVKDALHGVWLGHPLHPALVQLPVGAWTSAALLDLFPGEGRAARRLIAVGLLATLPAAAAGLADWNDLHEEQARVGVVHAAANTLAAGCYAASLVARRRGHAVRGKLYGWAGFAVALTSATIGGHLSYRQAAGANHAEQVPYLLPAGWHSIGTLEEFVEGQAVERRLGEVPLLAVRRGERVHVLADQCTHLAGPLHEGKLGTDSAGEPCVTCPWHGSTFRLADGAVVHGPATSPQPALVTRVVDGRVEVSAEPL